MKRLLCFIIGTVLLTGCAISPTKERDSGSIRGNTYVCLGETYYYGVSVDDGESIQLNLNQDHHPGIPSVTFLKTDCIRK